MLATGLGELTAIAVDASHVYAGTPAPALFAVPVAGGAATALAVPPTAPVAIAPSGAVLIVACASSHGVDTSESDGTLLRVPNDGGPATTLASSLPGPSALALDGEHAYLAAWGTSKASGVDMQNGELLQVPLAGGPESRVAALDAVTGLAIDASHFYWSQTCPSGDECRLIARQPR